MDVSTTSHYKGQRFSLTKNNTDFGGLIFGPLHQKGDPTFRKISTGELEKKPSQEALKQKASNCGSKGPPAKKPEEVEAEAKDRVLSEGGDPSNNWLVLSRYTIQFGQYKGQTFRWLLENDVDYVAYIVTSHQNDQEPTMSQNMANKVRAFTHICQSYGRI